MSRVVVLGVTVVGIPLPLRGLRSGLLPGPGATVDERTFGARLSS